MIFNNKDLITFFFKYDSKFEVKHKKMTHVFMKFPFAIFTLEVRVIHENAIIIFFFFSKMIVYTFIIIFLIYLQHCHCHQNINHNEQPISSSKCT